MVLVVSTYGMLVVTTSEQKYRLNPDGSTEFTYGAGAELKRVATVESGYYCGKVVINSYYTTFKRVNASRPR